MFKQKKYVFEILEEIQTKLDDIISSTEQDISRYESEISEIDRDENPWDYDWKMQRLDDAKSRNKAAADILKQLEKVFG